MNLDYDHTCSTSNEHETLTWDVRRLWEAAKDLPVEQRKVADLVETLKDTYCFGPSPTCWDMARHARQVYEADLEYPIILGAEGNVMDGSHRIAKAWMLGLETIAVVRFAVDPEPDTRVLKTAPPVQEVVASPLKRTRSHRLGFVR